MNTCPRPEYPRPQFIRSQWINLNGQWQFEIDPVDSGLARGLKDRPLSDTITVPFCPESPLSGQAHEDFMLAVWYRKEVTIPTEWKTSRVLLHFQAVDYDTTVWVNDQQVAIHRGGFTPFTCDLRGVTPGQKLTIVVRARDDYRDPKPRGKQSMRYERRGCRYTRTTGIWQTVWMEPVGECSLRRPRITPDFANSRFLIAQSFDGNCTGLTFRVSLKDHDGLVTRQTCALTDFSSHMVLEIPSHRVRSWSPTDPFLYDIELELLDKQNNVIDQASSYCGLRSVTIDGKAVKLNGTTIFQRLVLDQGYYPDGIMTAPTDAALIRDIELSMAAGFNGARLHQKVFEERFLYHADKLGYLVWGEFGDWGCRGLGPEHDHQRLTATYITQWLEAVERDYNHPSIIGWCPLNETDQPISDGIHDLEDVTLGMFLATKAFDTTRPVLDTSGYSHRVPQTDIYDSHDYEQDFKKFQEHHAGLANGQPFYNGGNTVISIPYAGQPFFISEFGGIWWDPQAAADDASWGYGRRPQNIEQFYERFKGLCDVLLDDPDMFGYCYTQLTDVYQEKNGIYFFDRSSKFDLDKLRAVQSRQAAIERIHGR